MSDFHDFDAHSIDMNELHMCVDKQGVGMWMLDIL